MEEAPDEEQQRAVERVKREGHTAAEAQLLADELKRQGYTTNETDPFAALADLRERKVTMRGEPEPGSGRHSKGGLYTDSNDYFGKDREPAD
jgi:hypothetical protein